MKNFNEKELNGKTILGVGPVSKITVDVALDLSKWRKVPIWLIPSRRQVECKAQGGGYVNGWSTEEFVKYVKEIDSDNLISFVRDHGGQYQGAKYENAKADYEAAIKSFKVDIAAGFDVLHVDSSKASPFMTDTILSELNDDRVDYEVNIDAHSAKLTYIESFKVWLSPLLKHQNIKFIAGNTGLFVYEAKNTNYLSRQTLDALLDLADKTNTTYMQHNCDYLRDDVMIELRKAGVKVVNVAPEYGVVETTALLEYLEIYGLKQERDAFISMVAAGDKWVKWFDHVGNASDLDKCLVSGHYYLNSPLVLELKEKFPLINDFCFDRVYEKMSHHLDLLGW
jgi:hypothetical protein